MKVADPSGQVWRIHRRWLPWNPRLRDVDASPDVGALDVLDGDDVGGVVVGIALAILLSLLLPVLVLLLVTGVEVVLVLAVLPFAVAGRVLLGRRWWVQVRRGRRLEREEMVGDWQASGLRVHDLAELIRRGDVAAAAGLPLDRR